MEQQLHAWFRYTVILGIYLRHTPTTTTTNQTNCENGARDLQARPNAKSRQVWLKPHQSNSISKYHLKRFYIKMLLLWILIMHIVGIVCRRRVQAAILTWVVGTILFTSQALTNMFIIIETLWQQDEHEAFLMQLQNIELSLKLRLRQDIEEEILFANTLRRYLCYLLIFSLTGLTLFLLCTFWLQYIGYFWYSLWFMTALRIRLIQLLIYLRVLHYYMLCLSKKLRQIVAYHTAPNLQTLDVNYTKLKSYTHLLAIKDIYAQLIEAFDLFNKFAGWSLLSIITCYMLDISCNFYWSLLSFDGLVVRKHYYIASVFWLSPMIAMVWHICQLGEECTQLDRLMTHLLCKIIIPSSSKSLTTYRIALQQFSMQLQLQHIKVSAKCVFNLDMQLIMSISTSIATYIVIITQFLNSSR